VAIEAKMLIIGVKVAVSDCRKAAFLNCFSSSIRHSKTFHFVIYTKPVKIFMQKPFITLMGVEYFRHTANFFLKVVLPA